MTIARDVMRTDLVTVHGDTPLRQAIELLVANRISGLPVVDSAGNLVGIFTEKDAMRLLYEESGVMRTVSDLMVREPRAFQQDAPLAEVCDCLMANHFRRVPILAGKKLVGLISRADLMPAILETAASNTVH
jgi:CBS domain-containing protein